MSPSLPRPPRNHRQATALLEQFQEVEIKCIRREENAPADRLVNEALDAALK